MDEQPTTTPAEPASTLEPIQQEALDAFSGSVKGAVEPNSPVVEEPVETPPEEPIIEKPAEEPVKPTEPEVTDPGDFKPNDHSYEVTLTDGKTRKVTTPEEADALAEELDANPELVNAKLLLELSRKSVTMEQGIAADKQKYDADKQTFEADSTSRENIARTAQQIESGVKFLETKGLIPPVDPKLDTEENGKLWQTSLKDETGIKERMELMAYMAENNKARAEVGLEPTFDAVGAYHQMKAEQAVTSANNADKKDAETRKKKGAMIGSQAAYTQSNVAPGEIVGPGGSLNELQSW